MRLCQAFVVLALPLVCAAQQAKEIHATTDDGRQVVLRPDGTWVMLQKPTEAPPPAASGRYTKPAGASRKVDAPFGDFALWIDPARWSEVKREPSRITFQHKNGQTYAMFIAEGLSVSTPMMKNIVLVNARNADPNVRIAFEEMRNVNGRDVLCLQLQGKVQGLPFQYYGYYYGGSSGNVQVVTYTLQTAFAANERDFTDLLNGLTISDKPVEGAAETGSAASDVLSLNDGKLNLRVDAAKWNRPKRNQDGRFTFTHVKGGGYVMIVSESIEIPLDALPDVALGNAKGADPEAKITFREKRKVNGLDVWALKIAAAPSKIPFVFYSYNYSGPEGTVQVITYTTPSSFADYEADFTELLNSLAVKK